MIQNGTFWRRSNIFKKVGRYLLTIPCFQDNCYIQYSIIFLVAILNQSHTRVTNGKPIIKPLDNGDKERKGKKKAVTHKHATQISIKDSLTPPRLGVSSNWIRLFAYNMDETCLKSIYRYEL